MLSAHADSSELASWLEKNLPPEWATTCASMATKADLNAAQLLAMSEEEAAAALGLTVFGRKRKLTLLLSEAKRTASSAASSSSAGAASSSDAASSSAGASSSSSAAAGSSFAANAPSADDAEDPLHTSALGADECDRQLHDESYALGLVQWAGKRMHELLSKPEHAAWATARLRASRLAELSALREETSALPGVSIVVVGNTGAGKSTLLNALLGEAAILPTNGMRACTACLIELRHEDSDPVRAPPYRAEIEFLTKQEWARELDDLLDDLTPNDGVNQGRVNLSVSEESPSYASWCKLYAIYGDDFTHSRVRTDRTGPGGRVIYDNPTLDSLKAKLSRCTAITHCLSTVQPESANDAKTFRRKCERYMDSVKDVAGGAAYWPLVKQVRLFSRKWETLKTGAVLIDAPGVHDDNSARDGVVKKKLKDADAVWIVSNIVRAVNDKTAKDLLGAQFRRQLLMDGQFGSLAFVATQSDVIQRAEAIRSLALPDDATLRQCARARNAYTARRLGADFKAGLREMARDAGESERGAQAMAERHSLPVFTVSSYEYQRLLGLLPHEGARTRVWREAEDTQLPALIRHVQRQALVRRKALSRRRCEAMNTFAASMLSLLQHEARLPIAVRDAAKGAFDAEAAKLTQALQAQADAAEGKIKQVFEEVVAPKLREGAGQAKADALRTAQEWGIPVTQGGLHWATYKATTRRLGVFRLNMNEALCEPIFKAVSTHWERSFLSGLSATLDSLREQVQQSLASFHPALLTALREANVPEDATTALGASASADGLLTSLTTVVGDIKESVQKQQRDLSRSMEPAVQEAMTPGYSAATAEAGTGSHRRRVAKLEGFVAGEAPKMFKAATDGVVSKMSSLASTIGGTLRKDVVHAARATLCTAYCPLWDELGDKHVQARRALVPGVQECLLETRNALRRLAERGSGAGAQSTGAGGGSEAGGAGGGDGDGDDDADVVDVTEHERQAKRARQQADAIELDDEPLDDKLMENVWPQAPSAQASGDAVKVERPGV